MEMQRWSSRWKTKRWLMDSTITAFITILVLQASSVRAGKNIRMNFIWPKGDRATTWKKNSVTDDGDWEINRLTWTQRHHVYLIITVV